jgi:TolA-binding protein
MTFVGKILVVMHLLFSVLFMAFAGAVFTAQKNWRADSEAKATQLAKAQADLRDASTQLQDLQNQKAATEADLNNKITQLSGEATSLRNENQSLDAENKQLLASLDAVRTQSQLSADEAGERVQEAQLQRERNAELRTSRDQQVEQVRSLADEVFGLNLRLTATRERYEALLRDNATMRSFLASKGLPTDPKQMVVNTQPAEPLVAVVMDIRPGERGASELVQISAGTDDGLEIGHRLTLFRDSKYLGQIELTYVTPDLAVGSVIPDLKAKNAVIQKGDNATTKF